MSTDNETTWKVVLSSKAKKQRKGLPPNISDALFLLVLEFAKQGPITPTWHHYGKLRGQKNTYHCHLNKGKPRYVAVWQIHNNQIKLLEVTYVGTHENAPY